MYIFIYTYLLYNSNKQSLIYLPAYSYQNTRNIYFDNCLVSAWLILIENVDETMQHVCQCLNKLSMHLFKTLSILLL